MKDRVVITGVGLVDSLGTSPMECWDNMISDDYVPPVDFETEVESLKGHKCFRSKTPEYIIPEGIRKPTFASLSTATKNALHVVQQAIGDVDDNDVAVVFSSVAIKSETMAKPFLDKMLGGKRLSPRSGVQYLKDFSAGLISQVFDFIICTTNFERTCLLLIFIF